MSAATIDRHLVPARHIMQLPGISPTTPAPTVLRNSIGLPKAGDTPPTGLCQRMWTLPASFPFGSGRLDVVVSDSFVVDPDLCRGPVVQG